MAQLPGTVGMSIDVLETLLAEGASDAQRVLLRAIPGGTFLVFDADLRFLFAEGEALRKAFPDVERDVEWRQLDDLFRAEHADQIREGLRTAVAGESVEFDVHYEDHIHWVHAAPVFDDNGMPVAGLAISVDVTRQRRAEARVRSHADAQSAIAELGRRALEGTSTSRLLTDGVEVVKRTLGVDAVSVMSVDEERSEYVMSAFTGVGPDIARFPRIPLTDRHRRQLAALGAGPEMDFDVTRREPDGPMLAAMGIASIMIARIGPDDRPYGLLGVSSHTPRHFSAEEADFLQAAAHILWTAIERAEAEEEYRHAALHDELTGLPNRRLFVERIEEALARARNEHCGAAVLLFDLDNFKLINDSLGHDDGDRLLCALAPRLRAVARDGDTVARLGGDEFALVCGGIVSDEHALELADRVATALKEPVELGLRQHAIKASVGLVVDGGEASADSLLRDADTAMHRAKERGGGAIERFSPAMHERAVARMRTESELHGAIKRDELLLHYQPFYTIPDRRLLGVEALVRWEHPRRGLVPPNEFIPLAEQSGLIVELGEWVLRTAATTLAAWRAKYRTSDQLTLSVNVSARQLLGMYDGSGHSLRHTVATVLDETGLPPGQLALELTESMLMEAGEHSESALLDLKQLGIQLMLDDFGTGHSSLSRLSDLPLDVVKIDRSFVSGLGTDIGREPIVAAIVAMARALDLRVIAEGVETDAEWRGLVAERCDAAQGYLLARPMPAEALAALLAQDCGERAA